MLYIAGVWRIELHRHEFWRLTGYLSLTPMLFGTPDEIRTRKIWIESPARLPFRHRGLFELFGPT